MIFYYLSKNDELYIFSLICVCHKREKFFFKKVLLKISGKDWIRMDKKSLRISAVTALNLITNRQMLNVICAVLFCAKWLLYFQNLL